MRVALPLIPLLSFALLALSCAPCPRGYSWAEGADGLACYELPPEEASAEQELDDEYPAQSPYEAADRDFDGDGHPESVDCDESDPAVHPEADEIPYDGLDQDCDEADLTDVDGDGYDAAEVGGADCDDEDADAHPLGVDIPYDGVDQDCVGGDLADVDGDGYDAYNVGGPDCDDGDPGTNPGVDEDCDGFDDLDCDGDLPADDMDCGVLPEGGSWSGSGIAFTVSSSGGSLYITHANYGSCGSGGCNTSSQANCGAGGCVGLIEVDQDGTSFSVPSMGCSGAFTSDTTATGSCSKYSSTCGCTMSRSWSASH